MHYSDYQNKVNRKQPTETQRDIINSTHYPDYLKAGAGTGKTEVLIIKILHIISIDESVGLDNFAIITFTNKATDEMKERLADRLYFEWLKHKKITLREGKIKNSDYMRRQVEISNMLDVSTIHGFCEKIIRKYGLYEGIPLNFKIGSIQNDVNNIIREVVNKYSNEKILNTVPEYKVAHLLNLFLYDNNNKGIELDDSILVELKLETPNNEFWNEFKGLFIKMYLELTKIIEKFKRDNNVLTTDDLIKKAAELMSNNFVANKVSAQYKYLFIDEFQDTNKNQFNLVNSLLNKGVKIFVVGDDKQSIYAFRGSDVQNSYDMSNIIESIKDKKSAGQKETVMNENFRTDYLLLEKINKIFDHEFTFDGSKLDFPNMRLDKIEEHKDASLSEKKPLKIIFETSLLDTINYLVNNETIREKRVTYGDIAILCRSNYDLDAYAMELKNENIPVEVFGGKGFFKSKAIIDTFKLFNSIINKGKAYQTELLFTDYYLAVQENTNDLNFDTFLEELNTVFREETVESVLNFIYKETNIEQYYYSKGRYQEIANLHKLKDKSRDLMSKEYLQPIQFLEYLNVMIMSNKEDDEADIEQSIKNDGVVSLFSIHKSKGLAFPIVIVPKLDKQLNRPTTYPKIIFHYKENENKALAIGYDYFNDNILEADEDYNELLEIKTKEFLEEEIRVLYVALTRAEHMLVLSCEKSENMLRRNKYNRSHASWAKWIAEIDNGRFIDENHLIINS